MFYSSTSLSTLPSGSYKVSMKQLMSGETYLERRERKTGKDVRLSHFVGFLRNINTGS